MNDENKIDLSIEMYEDLKETLVKAIKNAKAGGAGNTGLDNIQLERIERLIEAAERSQGQIAQQLEQLQRNTGSIRPRAPRCICPLSSPRSSS
jgi:hypothetical protein